MCKALHSNTFASAIYWSHALGAVAERMLGTSSAYTGAKAKRMLSSTLEQTGEHKANALQMLRTPGRMLGED